MLTLEHQIPADKESVFVGDAGAEQRPKDQLLRLPPGGQKTKFPLRGILSPNGSQELLREKQEYSPKQEDIRPALHFSGIPPRPGIESVTYL